MFDRDDEPICLLSSTHLTLADWFVVFLLALSLIFRHVLTLPDNLLMG